jgi:acetolactate synthase-1/2/3 large subunit
MAQRKFRGADALVAALGRAGVRQLFTLSGNHIMPVFDAALEAGMTLIHTRHEAAAVHMADAYARLTGEPGVALVTGGPGHANAVSALYTAQMAESPVVLLSGHAPTHELGMGAFQEMRQAELAAPVSKAASTAAGPDTLAAEQARAVSTARSGRPGPVQLNLPTDALEGPARDGEWPDAAQFQARPMPLATAAAEAVLVRLRQARRPLILLGPACLTRAGRQRSAALEAAVGIPVIGMESPRGVHDPSLGAFAQMLAQADCVLLLGKRLDFTLRFGRAPAVSAECRFLQIDADAAEFERSRRALGVRLEATAVADAASALDALTRLAGAPGGVHGFWREQVSDALRFRPPGWDAAASTLPGRLHPVQALKPLQRLLDSDADSVFVCDGGEFGQWAQACLQAPNRVINGVAGAIGSALPYALGARVARPDAPVVAVLGDGTFGFHAAEIDTAVRCGLPFLAVVGNDARWNAEYQIQLRDYGAQRLVGCELLPTRYDEVARAFGGFGALVSEPVGLEAALQQALQSGLPACLNVMIEGLAAPGIRQP